MRNTLLLILLFLSSIVFGKETLVHFDTYCDSQFCYRPLLQNIDGKVIEQMSNLCQYLLKAQGKPGSMLGSKCTPKDMYLLLGRMSDELGVKTVFGIYGRDNQVLYGIFSFDRVDAYPVIKQNMGLPSDTIQLLTSSIMALFKRFERMPYVILEPGQVAPAMTGMAYNQGFFGNFYILQNTYRQISKLGAKHTEFETCDFDGWFYPCEFRDVLEIIDPNEEKSLFKDHYARLILIVDASKYTKTLGYYKSTDEFVTLYRLDQRSTTSDSRVLNSIVD